MSTSARGWLEQRLGRASTTPSPREVLIPNRSVMHYLGGIALFLFLLEVASGILLLLPYRPDPDHAHESIIAIIGRIPYGGLVRGVHYWASQLFIGVLLGLVVGMLVLRRFRAPRELVWLAGLALLLLGIGMAFTGTILPWSQSAYLQALVSSELLGKTPLIGGWLERILRGGSQVSSWTLHHAYGFHTGVLPAVCTLIIAIHVWLIRGAARSAAETEPEDGVPIYPDFVVRLAAVCTGVLVVVISLATFAAPELGTAADLRVAAPEHVRPPWYFLFLHQLVRSAPAKLLGVESASFIMGALGLVGLGAVILPFVDRRGSRITLALSLILIALCLILSAYALV
ncbi:MAG: cytochrome b N-terminal domain-containing protein [Polyangiaceae bacterium]